MAKNHPPGARRQVPRSRGALSGIALMVLGAWGALIPFIGPYFNFSFTPDKAWHWTAARGWLEVLPGVVAFVAGLLLFISKSRTMTLVAAWLGVAAGAWFAVGPQLATVLHIGSPGQPAGTGNTIRALEVLALFTALGVVIVYFAATAFGRLSVVSLRDAHAAERREAEAAAAAEREQQIAAARERDEAAARERQAAEAAAAHERTAAGHDRDNTNTSDSDSDSDSDNNSLDDRNEGTTKPSLTDRVKGVAQSHDNGEHGSHSVTQGAEPQAHMSQDSGQQDYQQHVSPAQGYPEQSPGYAQPQNYDAQHGVQQVPAPQDEQVSDQQGSGRGLFRRR